MKPVPQNSCDPHDSRGDNRAIQSERSFPLTDYNFQATPEIQTTSSTLLPKTNLRAFRKLSADFSGPETNRNYFAELFLFTLITAVSAWPIISMINALARMIK